MIVIVDSGMANLKSVANAVDLLGEEFVISNKAEDIEAAEKIILPGVGTFSEGMANLEKHGLIKVLEKEVIEKKKPFLGICLGMHLLASEGKEGGVFKGLGFFPGTVEKFEFEDSSLKIPHMGWDDIIITKESEIFKGVRKEPNFYFVHSYYYTQEGDENVIAKCDYGGEFVVALQKDNIFATQFHPEKSQENGLTVLENFLNWKQDD
jgi:glutamine amidotransferase